MAVWTDVVDRLRGRKSLDRVTIEELEREKIKADLQERKQIAEVQHLERQKEKEFAKGVRENSAYMKLYHAQKVKGLDADVRLNSRVLKTIAHKKRVYNGIIAAKKTADMMAGDKKSLLAKMNVSELSQWVEKHTADGELKDIQLQQLMDALERGAGIMGDVGTEEEEDVAKIFELMQGAPVGIKTAEEIAKEAMPDVDAILRREEEA